MVFSDVVMTIINTYTPQQNGCAERTNRTVVDIARTMLLARNLPKFLWAEAINRTGPSSIDGKTPYELFTNRSAYLKKFHVFRMECFVHEPKEKRNKWDAKGKADVFVGYSDNVDDYSVWLKSENRIIRSKDVVFGSERVGKLLTLFSVSNLKKMEQEETEITANESVIEIEEECEIETNVYYLRNRNNLKIPEHLMGTEIDEPKDYKEAVM